MVLVCWVVFGMGLFNLWEFPRVLFDVFHLVGLHFSTTLASREARGNLTERWDASP